jgi:hypothetical protein
MAKKLDFKDFLNVDYAPGMPDLIKKNAKKRKGDTGAGSNAEYSSTHPPRQEQMHDPIALGKHSPNIGMGWTGKHRTVKDPGSKTGRHVHVFQYTEEVELDEVSQALGHKVAKARQAQASALRQKAVDEPDMMKAFAHTKAANKAERKAGQSYNRLMKKEEVEEEIDEALTMSQRLQRARLMRRFASRIKIGQDRAKRRIASPEKLQKRARRQARMIIFKKLTKDIPKSELTYARRQEIEKRLDKPAVKKRIERLAKRMLPKVRKAEIERKRGTSSND